MLHKGDKAWGAPSLRALNEVLGVELQPEELLLGAVASVEPPWGGESDEVLTRCRVGRRWWCAAHFGLEDWHQRGWGMGAVGRTQDHNHGRGKQQQKINALTFVCTFTSLWRMVPRSVLETLPANTSTDYTDV